MQQITDARRGATVSPNCPAGCGYGRGKRCQAAFWGAGKPWPVTRRGGTVDTTSGSSPDFSVRSIAASNARGASDSIGGRTPRAASLLQTGQTDLVGAVPNARLISKSPSSTHRYP